MSGVVSIFCPLLGVLICVGVGLAPFPAIQEARKKKLLGDINPIPFAMMVNGIHNHAPSRALISSPTL